MRRRLILDETDLLSKGFSLPTLLMVEYSSGYLLFTSVDLVLNWFSMHVNDDQRYVYGLGLSLRFQVAG